MNRITEKQVEVKIAENKQADIDATIVAENIAGQLERRIGFRRAMKQAVGRTMRLGAKGIKIYAALLMKGGIVLFRECIYKIQDFLLHILFIDCFCEAQWFRL